MSAGTQAYVDCDRYDKKAPAGAQFCYAVIRAGRTRAEARKAAKAAGWLVSVKPVAFPNSGIRYDYCPAHKAPEYRR